MKLPQKKLSVIIAIALAIMLGCKKGEQPPINDNGNGDKQIDTKEYVESLSPILESLDQLSQTCGENISDDEWREKCIALLSKHQGIKDFYVDEDSERIVFQMDNGCFSEIGLQKISDSGDIPEEPVFPCDSTGFLPKYEMPESNGDPVDIPENTENVTSATAPCDTKAITPNLKYNFMTSRFVTPRILVWQPWAYIRRV